MSEGEEGGRERGESTPKVARVLTYQWLKYLGCSFPFFLVNEHRGLTILSLKETLMMKYGSLNLLLCRGAHLTQMLMGYLEKAGEGGGGGKGEGERGRRGEGGEGEGSRHTLTHEPYGIAGYSIISLISRVKEVIAIDFFATAYA